MTPGAATRAALAGLLHGVAEWLPVSSSGHVALLIDAAGWPEGDPSRRRERRALEVALHTGSLVPIGMRVLGDVRAAGSPAGLVVAGLGATGLTSVVGGLAGPLVEERFAGPRSVAAGLVAGSIALIAAERAGRRGAARPLGTLTPLDVAAVGAAQGLAIWPGVSRRAATLASARARGLDPAAADVLSWAAGLPTLGAATAWQFWRTRSELLAAPVPPLAGAAASLAAGVATRRLPGATAAWPAARWALWRGALAAATLLRARR